MPKPSVKTYTCRLKTDVIQSIKQFAVQNNVSQSVVLEKAIDCLTDDKTDDRHNVRPDIGEVSSLLVEELRNKNQQIENLQNTINQQNHLLLLRFKNSGMLIEGNGDTEQTEKKDSKKKSKPKKGKGRGKKKKK
jgi:hypothetical protein